MKTLLISMLTLVFGLTYSMAALAGPGHDSKHSGHKEMPAMDKQQMAVVSVMKAYSAAINTEEVAVMENLVMADGTDFTIFEGSGKNIGWADYRDHHLIPEFEMVELVFSKYEYTNIKSTVSGDMAFATFAIDIAYTYKGEAKTKKGNGTAVLRLVDGQWKMTHLQTS
ncbi:nuclear transport factor 2 family protein [Oceanicaulis sp. AH-315-P02]|nr:nuclear transport factor 2 family protein [Robiginitomaculum sp.]MBN4047727.1 nuclear transport factor 2 family protein [Oceanicaulis sp. AH-315-P02]